MIENILILISAIIFTIILFLPSKILTGCPFGKTADLIPGGSCPYFIPGKNNLCFLAGKPSNIIFSGFTFSYYFPFVIFLILVIISILILFSKSVKLKATRSKSADWRIKTEGRFLLIGVSFVFFYFYWSKICPVFTLQTLFLQKELIVAKIFVFLIFLAPFFLALLFGRLFCGFICPIGGIQEIFFRLPRCQKPNLKFYKLPKILTLFPFLVLAILPVAVYKLKSPVFCQLDPFSFFFDKKYTTPFFLTSSFFLLTSIFIFRPFCSLFCPYGAILTILSKFSLFGLKIEKGKCKGCGACEKVCPAGVIKNQKILTENCFLCADCQKGCPNKAIGLSPLGLHP